MIVVLLGPPGSGKGTQAKLLSVSCDLGHLSTGDLLRAESLKETPSALHIRRLLHEGTYVDDHCIMSLLKQNFPSFLDAHQGCVLDGLPRTLIQAHALESFLNQISEKISAVIHIEVPRQDLLLRLTGRFVCRKCQSVYHKVFSPLAEEGVCDTCGAQDFYTRDDDRAELVSQRLDYHQAQIEPLLEYYKAHSVLRTVDGSQGIPLVSKRILECLGKAS